MHVCVFGTIAMTFLTPKGNESLLVKLQLRCIYYLLISDLGFVFLRMIILVGLRKLPQM